MSVIANDIAGFYHLFLGRAPENELVVQSKIGQNRATLFRGFLCSDEFAEMRSRLASARTVPVLAKPADVDLRRWAADFFDFDRASRERAADIHDRLSLLALCLRQPSGARQVDAILGAGEANAIAEDATRVVDTWLPGFTTVSDLSFCYRLILGRRLSSTNELNDHPDAPLAAMVAGFLASAEFEAVIARPALARNEPAAMTLPADLARWVVVRLGLRAGDGISAAMILADLLEKPAVACELERASLSWQPEALAGLLRAISPQSSGETQACAFDDPRIDFSMIASLPFEQALLPAWLDRVVLDRLGAPEAQSASWSGEADWIVIAPIGTRVPLNFTEVAAECLRSAPDVDILYADDVARRTASPGDRLRLKPDFDHTLLVAQDYVGSPIFIRTDAFARLGGLRTPARTAASADLLFRANAAGMRITRLPSVLLGHPHERVQATEADYRAILKTHLGPDISIEGGGHVPFRQVRHFLADDTPAVTLIIPTCRTMPAGGSQPYVVQLLESLRDVDWPMDKMEVLVGDDLPDTPDWERRDWPFPLRRARTPRAAGQAFNYAAKMNGLWRQARTAQMVFLNDDVLPLDPGWLKALITFSSMPEIGGVGGLLFYPDGSLQHVGLAPAPTGAVHVWAHRRSLAGAYQDWARTQRECAMVTGAVFATTYEIMDRFHGFDERLSLEFNDTDLCLRMREQGLRIISNPAACFIHSERSSRGSTPPPASEEALFRQRWQEWLKTDPSWHPRLRMRNSEVEATGDGMAWYR